MKKYGRGFNPHTSNRSVDNIPLYPPEHGDANYHPGSMGFIPVGQPWGSMSSVPKGQITGVIPANSPHPSVNPTGVSIPIIHGTFLPKPAGQPQKPYVKPGGDQYIPPSSTSNSDYSQYNPYELIKKSGLISKAVIPGLVETETGNPGLAESIGQLFNNFGFGKKPRKKRVLRKKK